MATSEKFVFAVLVIHCVHPFIMFIETSGSNLKRPGLSSTLSELLLLVITALTTISYRLISFNVQTVLLKLHRLLQNYYSFIDSMIWSAAGLSSSLLASSNLLVCQAFDTFALLKPTGALIPTPDKPFPRPNML